MMPVKLILFIFLLIIRQYANAQNLVQNGGFEQYSDCPKQIGQLYFATRWYNPTGATPDLYNVCNNAIGGGVGVPTHPGGYQFPHSGDGYCGFIPAGWPSFHVNKSNYREYISNKLQSPLITGNKYCITMHLAISKNSKYAIDQLSVYFSKDSVFKQIVDDISNITPQVNNPKGVVLADTTGWQKITHEYEAEDAYLWMTIGNFNDYNNTQAALLRNIPDRDCIPTYYYIDDISIVAIPENDGWIPDEILPCNTPINVSAGYFDEYLWSTGETSANITISTPGTYWVSVVSACGMYTDTFSVDIKDTTTTLFQIADVEVICGSPAKVTLSNSYDTYKWSTNDITSTITVDKGGIYWATVTNSCGIYSDTFYAKRVDTTSVAFTISDKKIHCNTPVTIPINNYDEYLWSTGETTPAITLNSTGKYWATVTNNCGIYSDSFTVENVGCVFIPNVFSPNGDGLNDIFRPIGITDPDGYQLNIYNRWGELVYTTNNINAGWNGMHQASLADVGVYYWQLRYRYKNESFIKKGSVTIIR